MTKAIFTRYLRRALRLLSLQEWQVDVSFPADPPLPDTTAGRVLFNFAGRTAQILLNPDDADGQAQRVAYHECLHLSTAPLDTFVKNLVGQLSPQAEDVAWAQWTELEEALVVKLERALLTQH